MLRPDEFEMIYKQQWQSPASPILPRFEGVPAAAARSPGSKPAPPAETGPPAPKTPAPPKGLRGVRVGKSES